MISSIKLILLVLLLNVFTVYCNEFNMDTDNTYSGENADENKIYEFEEASRTVKLPILAQVVVYSRDSILQYFSRVIYGTEAVLNGVSAALTWLVYFVFGVVDLILRGPIYILKWCLQFMTLVLDLFLYLTGQGRVLAFEVIISFLLNVITSTTVLILDGFKMMFELCIYLTSTILLVYINCVDFILVSIIFPFIDAVIWMAFLVLLIVILYIVASDLLGIHVIFQRQVYENNLRLVSVFLIVVLFVGMGMFKTILAGIIFYILHPALYVIVTGALSFMIYLAIVPKMLTFVQVFYTDARTIVIRNTVPYLQLLRVMYRQLTNNFRKPTISDKAISSSEVSECVICFEEGRDFVILFPCEHEAICESCIGQIVQLDRRCPLCRTHILYYRVPE